MEERDVNDISWYLQSAGRRAGFQQMRYDYRGSKSTSSSFRICNLPRISTTETLMRKGMKQAV